MQEIETKKDILVVELQNKFSRHHNADHREAVAHGDPSSLTKLSSASNTSAYCTAQRIVDCRCLLGEGIIFDNRNQSVLWTDIYGKRIHQLQLILEESIRIDTTNDDTVGDTLNPTSTTCSSAEGCRIQMVHSVHQVPKQLCSFGLLEQSSSLTAEQSSTASPSLTLLCAWDDGFSIFDVVRGHEFVTSQGPDVRPNKCDTRLNDGRVDPSGKHYVCGGFYGEDKQNYEQVFMVGQGNENGSLRLFHEPIRNRIQTTNSICWTLDAKRMYLADSPAKIIWTYSYDPETSALSDQQVFHTFPDNEPFVPDGSCVDVQGYLWNAVWCHGDASGRVQRLHPQTGQVVFTVLIPDVVSQVSCCCFGGKNLDILFITTACDGRDEETQPYAGALYAVWLPIQGRPESRLKFSYNDATNFY